MILTMFQERPPLWLCACVQAECVCGRVGKSQDREDPYAEPVGGEDPLCVSHTSWLCDRLELLVNLVMISLLLFPLRLIQLCCCGSINRQLSPCLPQQLSFSSDTTFPPLPTSRTTYIGRKHVHKLTESPW